jgi:hypothetical protein
MAAHTTHPAPRASGGTSWLHGGSDEEIVSDGEAEGQAWVPPQWEEPGGALRQLNGLLPPAAAVAQQQQLCVAAARGKAFTRTAPSKPAPAPRPAGGGVCNRSSGFRRPMKTAAAAEADRAAVERAAAETAELEDALAAATAAAQEARHRRQKGAAGQQESGDDAAHHPHQPAPTPAGQAPSFVNRRRASAMRPLSTAAAQLRGQTERADPPAAAAAAAEGSSLSREEAAAAEPRPQRQQPPPSQQQQQQPALEPAQQQEQQQQQRRPRLQCASGGGVSTQLPIPASVPAPPAPARQAAATAAPAAPPAAIYHRTADGLNVVYLNRQAQQEQPEAGGGRGRTESVNTGWGNNFVRIDMKVSARAGQGSWDESWCGQVA